MVRPSAPSVTSQPIRLVTPKDRDISVDHAVSKNRRNTSYSTCISETHEFSSSAYKYHISRNSRYKDLIETISLSSHCNIFRVIAPDQRCVCTSPVPRGAMPSLFKQVQLYAEWSFLQYTNARSEKCPAVIQKMLYMSRERLVDADMVHRLFDRCVNKDESMPLLQRSLRRGVEDYLGPSASLPVQFSTCRPLLR